MHPPADGQIVFQSGLPYEGERIHAAAVYCSDGRLGRHIDDFLDNSLTLPRYDRLAIPGGPACFGGHFGAQAEEFAFRAHLQFLIHVHDLRRVVLIAHQNCAYYSSRLNISPHDREQREKDDLIKAMRTIRNFSVYMQVEAYFAAPVDGRISFETVQE